MSSFLKKISLATKKSINKLTIKDETYTDFVNMLNIDKIQSLSTKFNTLDKKEGKVDHKKFIIIMTEVFGNNPPFIELYQMIFNRFKILKCYLFNEKDKLYATEFHKENDINPYEICCALTVFMKNQFKEKVKMLFDLTDIDSDGYINEKEVLKLITSLNFLFSEEESPFQTGSSIITQSITNIKTKSNLELLMNYPGELGEILKRDIYINFETFYSCLTKIPNYKFKIFPCFVSFKKCLEIRKKEKYIDVVDSVKEDFIKIADDVMKSSSIHPPNKPKNKNKLPIIKKNFLNLTKGNLKRKPTRKMSSLSPNNFIGRKNEEFTDTKKDHCHRGMGLIKNSIRKLIPNAFKGEIEKNSYYVNLGEIKNLEVHPGFVNFVESKKSRNHSMYFTQNNRERISTYYPRRYMNMKELITEIGVLSNKHKIDEQLEEKLMSLESDLDNKSFQMKNLLQGKSNRTGGRLYFGRYKDLLVKI